ncbi:hypothetical protein DPX16_5629 [Anabarilius grahami]|uniref:Retrotransposon gag domain-containing protein n=1 Tax=Anabarilius grahami TaxID=495550 RepID=A0A3N0YPV9_ANAGA|nr:hypothetical protein DPX16_5629 [Anabarilius grahami]
MGIFLTPVNPESLQAEDRLCRLRQSGRPLERYVEEFLEVSYLVGWPDASLNAVFLMGLDKDIIRYSEPACNFSLVNSINLILFLNGSNFEVDEIKKNQHYPCPAPSAAYQASPAHLTPEPCTYRFNGPVHSWPSAFPRGRKWVSNSADLGAKVADQMMTSVSSFGHPAGQITARAERDDDDDNVVTGAASASSPAQMSAPAISLLRLNPPS